MAYDEHLASRVREALGDAEGISEQQMFGGLAVLRYGNMVCGVMGDELMLRLGPELADAALDEPNTRLMDFTGRPMKSMVIVEPPGFPDDEALAGWVERALGFAATLPPKR